MLVKTSHTIRFPDGSTAIAQFPQTPADLTLSKLGFKRARPAIVLVGGASGLQQDHVARLQTLFTKVLAPLAEALGAVVVDGGTDVGIMRMMGTACRQTRSTFPLIGVLPTGMAILPNQPSPHPDAASLEPNHSHFILVPGANWGDESSWLADVATMLAQKAPSITVLVNGGEITWQDAAESVRVARPIVAIAGSGRTADKLVSALKGEVTDLRAPKIVASGLLQSVDLLNLEGLAIAIQHILRR